MARQCRRKAGNTYRQTWTAGQTCRQKNNAIATSVCLWTCTQKDFWNTVVGKSNIHVSWPKQGMSVGHLNVSMSILKLWYVESVLFNGFSNASWHLCVVSWKWRDLFSVLRSAILELHFNTAFCMTSTQILNHHHSALIRFQARQRKCVFQHNKCRDLCWLIAGIQGIEVSLEREQFTAAREMLSLHVQDTRTSTSRALHLFSNHGSSRATLPLSIPQWNTGELLDVAQMHIEGTQANQFTISFSTTILYLPNLECHNAIPSCGQDQTLQKDAMKFFRDTLH